MIWMLWMPTSSGLGSSTYIWRNRLELHLTLKLDFNLAVNELISLQNFTKSSPFVMSICFPRFAVRQAVVVVGFLGVIVRSHFVHPKHDWIPYCILHQKKKHHILQREDQRSDFLHTSKQERKKERKTDFIRQRQTWRVFAVNKCQCCCIELRRIQTKKKSHPFLLLSTTGRTGTEGNKQGSFALLCFTLWSYSVALHRCSKKSKQAVHNNSTICICIRLCCCIVKGFHWSCSFLFLFLLLVRLPLLRLVFLVMFLLLLDHIGLLLLHIKWYWI